MRVPVGACEHEETIARGVVLAVDDVVNGHHAGQSLASIVKLGDLFVLHTHTQSPVEQSWPQWFHSCECMVHAPARYCRGTPSDRTRRRT